MLDYTVVIIRLSQPSLAGVGAGAELGNMGITYVPQKEFQPNFIEF